MKFVTVRELRSKTAALRKDLEEDQEIVLTANGRPFAVMSRIEPDALEQELQAIRRARAAAAVARIRAAAKAKGVSRLTLADIDRLITETRRRRAAR